MKPEFKETQRFTQWWLQILLSAIGIIPIVGLYKQLILNEPFGNNPMSDTGLILFSIAVFGFLAFFKLVHLKTEINRKEITINFYPMVKKRIYWTDIKNAKIVKYGFVGYGIRIGSKHGTIYNIKGNKGIAIELKNGKKFLIGTQKQSELQKIIDKYTSN
ncbi:hypothetical protein [Leptobacterium sp. I13]|uniref:hypothetical protein n=1 Tax=Leptobacterium meishanense TaxID=3128904 RepID=UPI0030ED6AFC